MKTPLLITMAGPRSVDISSLSNFEAGLAFLGVLNRLNPGITFGQLAAMIDRPQTMSGWLTDLGKAVGTVKDGIGDVLKDTASAIGGGAGDAVRLVTSKPVIDGASQMAAAYATDGASASVSGMFKSLGQGDGSSALKQFEELISGLGASAKDAAAGSGASGNKSLPAWVLPSAIGAGVLGLVFVVRR